MIAIKVRCLTHCVFCGGESILITTASQVKQYKAGAHAQYVWPEKSIDWREMWISGSHGYCFDKAFGDDNQEE